MLFARLRARLREARPIWSTAVYRQAALTLPPVGESDFLLASTRRLGRPRDVHTRADPFLFGSGEDIYLFIETQVLDDPGRIEGYVAHGGAAQESAAPGRADFRSIGTVLAEPFHLSYPHVFAVGTTVYMLPESQEAGAVRLYRFADFPRKLELYRELLAGRYADPSPLFVNGVWYLFATSSRGLELFVTDDLIDGTLALHPASPITADPCYSRCGGVPFVIDGQLVRPAQDCTDRYGANLNLMRIDRLSPTEYSESLLRPAIFTGEAAWNVAGGHHVSVWPTPHGVTVAIDGQIGDYLVHRIAIRVWMMMTSYRRPSTGRLR